MNTDYTPYAKQRDSLIKSISKKHKIKFNRYHDHCLLEPDFLKTKSKTPHQVFSPYARAHMNHTYQTPNNQRINFKNFKEIELDNSISLDDTKNFIPIIPTYISMGGDLKDLSSSKRIQDGEHEKYSERRDKFDYDSTFLSAYLKFGCISVRETYKVISDTYYHEHPLVRQLVWRDFTFKSGIIFHMLLLVMIKINMP